MLRRMSPRTRTPAASRESIGSARDDARAPTSAEENVLLARYAPLVRRIAFDLQSMRPEILGQDDVVQDGMIGLLRAIRSNRSEPGDAAFAAYARTNIRGAIIDGYRAAGSISRREYAAAKATRRALEAGTEVSVARRAHAEQTMAAAWMPRQEVSEMPDDNAALRDPFPGPEQRAMSNELLRKAVDALQAISVRDRSIFIACELAGERQTLLASRFRVSVSRISQIIREVRRQIVLAIA